jgi:ERCC4-type nuclease
MLVSPAEPDRIKRMIGERGRVSSLPEKFGADFMWTAHGVKWLVQRKEVRDLLSSVADGRLAKEVGQMKAGRGVVVIEGELEWTVDGELVSRWGQKWTRHGWMGLQWSLAERGVWVLRSAGMADTVEQVLWLEEWSEKTKHRSLDVRPGARGMWGTKASDRDWMCHLLQGFPGIGPELADRIVEHFGGRVPLVLDTRGGKLEDVPGLGPKKAQAIRRLIGDGGDESDEPDPAG